MNALRTVTNLHMAFRKPRFEGYVVLSLGSGRSLFFVKQKRTVSLRNFDYVLPWYTHGPMAVPQGTSMTSFLRRVLGTRFASSGHLCGAQSLVAKIEI